LSCAGQPRGDTTGLGITIQSAEVMDRRRVGRADAGASAYVNVGQRTCESEGEQGGGYASEMGGGDGVEKAEDDDCYA